MNEEEWLTSLSPVAMLYHLNADGYARKPLLYAAAVISQWPELLTEKLEEWQRVLEAVLAKEKPVRALDWVQTSAEFEAIHLTEQGSRGARAQYAAILDAVFCTWITHSEESDSPLPPEELEPVRRANADLVRDIFGNPFRPVSFAPEWHTDTVVAIARQMYESRDFNAMPILADALQDAGCNNDEVLRHCRAPQQVHVRGCWVVDLVLGYE